MVFGLLWEGEDVGVDVVVLGERAARGMELVTRSEGRGCGFCVWIGDVGLEVEVEVEAEGDG